MKLKLNSSSKAEFCNGFLHPHNQYPHGGQDGALKFSTFQNFKTVFLESIMILKLKIAENDNCIFSGNFAKGHRVCTTCTLEPSK